MTTVTPNSAVTPQNVKSKIVTVLTAMVNPNSDTPTNTVELVKPTAKNGVRLVRVEAIPRDTTVACRIELFKSPDNGTTKKLWRSKDATAYTSSTTVGPTAVQAPDFGFSDLNPAYMGGDGSTDTEVIYVGVTVTQTGGGYDVYAEWMEY